MPTLSNITLLSIILVGFGPNLGCAVKTTSRSPNQAFEVNLKDKKGQTQVQSKNAENPNGTALPMSSDEETRRQAEAMKSAVANAVEKAEANHERVTQKSAPAVAAAPVVNAKVPAKTGDKTLLATSEPEKKAEASKTSNNANASVTAASLKHQSQRTSGSVSADQSLKWLKNGNRRFVKGFLRNDGISAKDRARVVKAQKPHAVIVTSSDSRVPPEIVFDQKLGEIFVHRLPAAETNLALIKTLQEGVGQLGANLVVVMGVNSLKNWENPRGLAHDLTQNTEILRDAVASGSVKVVPALYNLETGMVTWAE